MTGTLHEIPFHKPGIHRVENVAKMASNVLIYFSIIPIFDFEPIPFKNSSDIYQLDRENRWRLHKTAINFSLFSYDNRLGDSIVVSLNIVHKLEQRSFQTRSVTSILF